VETRTSGSAGGHGKRTRGNPDTAPVPDLTAATRRRSCLPVRDADHRWSAARATFWNPTGMDPTAHAAGVLIALLDTYHHEIGRLGR